MTEPAQFASSPVSSPLPTYTSIPLSQPLPTTTFDSRPSTPNLRLAPAAQLIVPLKYVGSDPSRHTPQAGYRMHAKTTHQGAEYLGWDSAP